MQLHAAIKEMKFWGDYMKEILSKGKFAEIIASYKELLDFTDELNNVFDKYNCDGEIYPPMGTDTILTLLEYIFDDRDEWISYWMFKLDFGNEYEDGYVKDKDGKYISLKTSDDLYALLVDNYRSNHPDAEVR